MKKLILLLTGTIALILVVAPKLVGLLLNDNSVAGSLRDLTGQPGLTLELDSGWFSSQGTLTIVDPVISGTAYPGVQMTTPLTVMHGPLLITADGVRLGLAAAELLPAISGLVVDDPLQQLFLEGLQNPMTLIAGLDRSLHLYANTDPLEYRDAGDQLNLSNLQVDLSIAADRSTDLILAIKDGTMLSPYYQVTAHGSRLQLHNTDLSAAPLPGSLQISIDELRLNSPEQLTARGIRLDYVARPDNNNGTVTITQDLVVGELESTWPVTALTLHSELAGVDPALASVYLNLMREAQLQGYGDPRAQRQLEQQGQLLARDMLRRPLQQQSTLTVQAYDGEHQAQLVTVWPGLPDLQSLDRLTVGDILRNLDVTLDIIAQEEALLHSPLGDSISAYQNQGVLPGSNNGTVTLNASLQGATLTINELQLPLEAFIDTDARPFGNAQPGLPIQP